MLWFAGVVAVLSAGIAAMVQRPLLRRPPERLVVTNHKGAGLPLVGGIVLIVTFLSVEGLVALSALVRPAALAGEARALASSPMVRTFFWPDHPGILIVVLGFFSLGLIDDLLDGSRSRGFRGHLSALGRGEVTGGLLKVAGGGAVALTAGALWRLDLAGAVLDGLLVALTANLINLFDLRPGRAVKVFFLGWVPLAIAGWQSPYLPLSAAAAGAAAVWLAADLRERGMLGDGGANLLGGLLGAGMALLLGDLAKLAVLGGLVVVTTASELFSFTRFIERVPPLRFLDNLGRLRG